MKRLDTGLGTLVVTSLFLFGCGDTKGDAESFGGTTGGNGAADDRGGDTTTSGADEGAGDDQGDEPVPGDDGGSDDGMDPPVVYDVNGAPSGEDDTDARLFGTVWAPNGEIPVAGALVYTTPNRPDGIPQEVYCAECEALGPDDHFTTTQPDGTFTLATESKDSKYLVVTKGQFMRVTEIDVQEGDVTLEDELTTLPRESDPDNGLFIPLIAVGDGTFDRLEDALGKFGLGDTNIENMQEKLVPGTEPFELWDNSRNPETDGFVSQGTIEELIADPDRLAQYHIIFLPCASDTYVDALDDPQNVQNIRDWVAAGGRWYVSDWANEWLINVFPEYQTLHDDGFGTDLGSYDSIADVLDPDLLAWLGALPEGLRDINPLNDEAHPTLFTLPRVETVDNWSAITATPPVLVEDENGTEVDVGHKVWLEGPGLGLGVHPLTITGQFGCGKIQFTSYHTAEFFDYVGLSPQELVLIYTILEIGTCQTALPPPQG